MNWIVRCLVYLSNPSICYGWGHCHACATWAGLLLIQRVKSIFFHQFSSLFERLRTTCTSRHRWFRLKWVVATYLLFVLRATSSRDHTKRVEINYSTNSIDNSFKILFLFGRTYYKGVKGSCYNFTVFHVNIGGKMGLTLSKWKPREVSQNTWNLVVLVWCSLQ